MMSEIIRKAGAEGAPAIVRRVMAQEVPVLSAFLARHAETSMFLRESLLSGIDGGPEPKNARFWWVGEGAVALSTAGFLSVQLPSATPADLVALRAALAGERVFGIAGEAGQVAALLPALELGAPRFNGAEPLCRLQLSDLRVPEGDAVLRRPLTGDLDWLGRWRQSYEAELHGAAELEAVTRHIAALMAQDRLRILMQGGVPVAITAFNARLPAPAQMVQVGGVYTPTAYRGRGYARLAVALHLAEARGQGAETAILFASGPPALRAYQAIGFRQVGAYRLTLFPEARAVPVLPRTLADTAAQSGRSTDPGASVAPCPSLRKETP
ncbi:hypothetical protein CDV53_00150 [Haematobacter missouriensis]|uniref:N-acetyltransferase domain-containing protein n=2 Tax=Haematobacter missouriensis TaxID=366616 RepID=A0ABX3ZY47_9RHOB|nr:hypothetical protein CDV53_00150 [Haematobacter missouriensis]